MSDESSVFTCPHCGESHAGYPTDYGFSLPDEVWAIPEEKRESLAKWDSDLCQMGERYFIRGVLPVPFVDQDGYFGWGLWVEVNQQIFKRYLQLYEHDGSSEPPAPAKIANQPPGYAPIVGSPVSIQFGSPTERPTIQFSQGQLSLLAIEQAHGISSAQYHKILETIGVL